MKGSLRGFFAWGSLALALALGVAACGSSSVAARPSPRPSPALPSPSPSVAAANPVDCSGGTPVTTATELTAALKSATPGQVIVLAAGTYDGQFVTNASGTSTAPITLCGSRDAILNGGDISKGYTLHLDGASWWRLVGFTITGGQKGVMTDHANHNLISQIFVHDVGDEAIHLRSASSDNVVSAVVVRGTGLLKAKFGEGIYIGSAQSNWCKYAACGPDMSDRNVIDGCDVANTTAESVDIKEGTTGGTLSNCKFSGTGMVSGATKGWVNVKGNGWTIKNNVGTDSPQDGFGVHEILSGWGRDNVFHGNVANVNGPGYGYYIQSSSLNTVLGCDNTATGAASGLSNEACS